MTLDELNKLVADDDGNICCGEVVEDEAEDSTLEEDLGEALDLLEQAVQMMEDIKIRGRRIMKIPEGINELLDECHDFLDQWPSAEDEALKGL